MVAEEEVTDWTGATGKVTEAARDTLADAAGLLQEDTDAAEILAADLFALLPAPGGALLRIGDASVDAAAKLVAGVLSRAPVLPGAIRASRDLVASVYVFRPPVVGLLQDARFDLRIAIDNNRDELAVEHGDQARLRLSAAVKAAAGAQGVHPLCVTKSPHRGKHMAEAKQFLRTAIDELDEALAALREMRGSVKHEEILVRQWGVEEASASAREARSG
ncbi:hypothetical protein E2562_036567 [Oryza meyeriana var. granulata]|uniref:Uncharacterized protein n=1 Tax=Oryza meyeriana var. granulata TaxID=110450 RepID=A0A6G1ECQ0_9ORYZ|nr:hypothetical protein E2562_036567 [Oryza meyeriana var. granulata]